jgi:hypothetical protein
MSSAFSMSELIESLRLLAADYEIQVNALPKAVHVPDELALTFGDSFSLVEQNRECVPLNSEQWNQLQEISQILEQMAQRKELWTLQSVKSDLEWEEMRVRARKLLGSMDQAIMPPDLAHLQYITT